MKQNNPSRSRAWPRILAAVTLFASAAAARGETVYVSDTANVLSDEGPASTLVATAPQGTAMNVISRDGDWINVQLMLADGSSVTGWVLAATVQSSAPGGNLLAGLSGGNNASASDVTATAASKGLNPEASDWAKTNNLDPTLELKMEADRKKITGADWKSFRALPDGTKLGKGS